MHRSEDSLNIKRAQLLDNLKAALVAHLSSFEFTEVTPESEAFSRGYQAALRTIAVSFNLGEGASNVRRIKPGGNDG